MYELLVLLLPIAAISGWWMGRRSVPKEKNIGKERDPAYFRGLNYLLNEQPDKAIDLFIELLEVDAETVDTHLALGGLFRRRGEVDRAIRIHQNLLDHTVLDQAQHTLVVLELGQDYMRAGLFDRAGGLFNELATMGQYCELALANLKEIYQQEKDWGRCLEVATQLETKCGQAQGLEKAHYYCEQAEEALRAKRLQDAWSLTCKATAANPDCTRTTMLRAKIELARQNPQAAIKCYHQAIWQDMDIVNEALVGLLLCYKQIGEYQTLIDYLRDLYSKNHTTKILLVLTDLLQQTANHAEAEHLIDEHIRHHTDLLAMERFIAIKRRRAVGSEYAAILDVLQHGLHGLSQGLPTHTCVRCGFAAHQMHWQCPGCKGWGTVRPTNTDASAGT